LDEKKKLHSGDAVEFELAGNGDWFNSQLKFTSKNRVVE
jgi:hypothetical protein